MLISADIKGLELVAAARLSGCPILNSEIISGQDIHKNNENDLNLKSRYIAKRFQFKLLYGGTAYGFYNDPEFIDTGYKVSDWESIIATYYEKYYGIKKWHEKIVDEATSTGLYISPYGREYDFRPLFKFKEWYYIPKIKNYPVQGFGADIVMLARIELFNRMPNNCKALLCNTIHDSIVVDALLSEIVLDKGGKKEYNIVHEIEGVFKDLPSIIRTKLQIPFDLPLGVEISQLGTNKKV